MQSGQKQVVLGKGEKERRERRKEKRKMKKNRGRKKEIENKKRKKGIPGWHSGLAPAFGPGHDPGDPGSNPTSGSQCMEPASPSACVSASFYVSHE